MFIRWECFAGLVLVLSVGASAALLGCVSQGVEQPEKERAVPPPDIVVFLVDDLGWQDVSLALHDSRTPFNDRYRTPHLESLAARGVRFTNAYAASPVCTPTRTSILTGLHPAATRITNWTLRADRDRQETGPASYPLRSPEWNCAGLSSADTTLSAVLADSGYRTMHVGKAHFGAIGTEGADPCRLGFAVNVAGHAAGAPASFLGEDGYAKPKPSVWDVPGLEQYHGTDVFLTDALTRETMRLLDDAATTDAPFFLHLSHYAVHTPLAADARYFDAYLERGLDRREAMYAAMIEGVDASLGAVLQKLRELGRADRTLVVFLSDNGGLTYAARGKTPTGTGANTHNAPVRSGKGSAYEGGTRIPMVVAWAGDPPSGATSILAGGECHVPVTTDDLFPTLLEITGVVLPPATDEPAREGISLVPLLGDPLARSTETFPEERALFWHYPHKWGPDGPGYDPFTSIRRN